MSLEHTPEQEEKTLEFSSVEGNEEGSFVVTTPVSLESFQAATGAHFAGLKELDTEADVLRKELNTSLPTPEGIEKIEGVSKRVTANKVATGMAMLALGTAFAPDADAAKLRIYVPSVREQTSNQIYIQRLESQYQEIILREKGIVAEIERVKKHAAGQGPEKPRMSESTEKRMDTEYEAKVAALETAKLAQEESLAKTQMSDAMRAAKTRQTNAEYAAKLAALADQYNRARESEVSRSGQGGMDTYAPENDERKIESLQLQLLRLDSQAREMKMRINGQKVEGALGNLTILLGR